MAEASPRRLTRLGWAGEWGRRLHKGQAFDLIVALGLVAYGLVYLLVAAIAVRIAVTGQRGLDTPYAALDDVAETELGQALLWVTALGLGALTLWQVFETVWRRDRSESSVGKNLGRTGSTFSAIGYGTLTISAARVAAVGRDTREGRRPPLRTTTGTDETGLRILVVVGGVVLLVLAVRSIYRGARRLFLMDLADEAPVWVVRLGQGGHIGKGVTYGIVGGLMIYSAVRNHIGPADTQTVFRLLNLSPSGGFLLVLKAVGLTLFGVYCFAWAANRRR